MIYGLGVWEQCFVVGLMGGRSCQRYSVLEWSTSTSKTVDSASSCAAA